jgi:hypothetical protein
MAEILYIPWHLRYIENENKRALESLDSQIDDLLSDSEQPDLIEQLIAVGKTYES